MTPIPLKLKRMTKEMRVNFAEEWEREVRKMHADGTLTKKQLMMELDLCHKLKTNYRNTQ